jgi:UDP-2,3-diacylglucosamine pyrophosphatase LpxH
MLVIVSDFHISEGLRLESKKLSPNEDFFFDDAFKRFLDHISGVDKGNVHLVMNGDTFDFLQVLAREEDVYKSEDKGRSTSMLAEIQDVRSHSHTLKYGAATEATASARKLVTIAAGHGHFFNSIGGFLSKGNRLTVLTGNHDIELFWPEVQTCFRELVNDPGEDALEFSHWFFYDKTFKVYVEHGNQYEAFNSFLNFLCPLLRDEKHINLPFGSFLVRYFFNQIESEYPFAENVKPPTKYIAWAINEYKFRPIRLFGMLYCFIKTLVKTFNRSGGWFRPDIPEDIKQKTDDRLNTLKPLFKNGSVLEQIAGLRETPINNTKSYFLSRVVTALSAIFYVLGLVFVILAPLVSTFGLKTVYGYASLLSAVIFALLGRSISYIMPLFMKDPSEYASEIGRVLEEAGNDVKHIVFGHTHEPDIIKPDKIINYINKNTGNGGRRFIQLGEGMTYFNTGTWDVIFSEEEKLIRDKMQFACLVFEDAEKEPVLMRWNDNVGECETLPLFDRHGALSDRILLYLMRCHKGCKERSLIARCAILIMRCIALLKGHHFQIKGLGFPR